MKKPLAPVAPTIQPSKQFWQSLERVLETFLPDEWEHFRYCSRSSRRRHIYRDLHVLNRELNICKVASVTRPATKLLTTEETK